MWAATESKPLQFLNVEHSFIQRVSRNFFGEKFASYYQSWKNPVKSNRNDKQLEIIIFPRIWFDYRRKNGETKNTHLCNTSSCSIVFYFRLIPKKEENIFGTRLLAVDTIPKKNYWINKQNMINSVLSMWQSHQLKNFDIFLKVTPKRQTRFKQMSKNSLNIEWS